MLLYIIAVDYGVPFTITDTEKILLMALAMDMGVLVANKNTPTQTTALLFKAIQCVLHLSSTFINAASFAYPMELLVKFASLLYSPYSSSLVRLISEKGNSRLAHKIRHDIALLTDIIVNLQSDDKGIEIKCRALEILTKVFRFKDTRFKNLLSAESRDELYIADVYVNTYNYLIDAEKTVKITGPYEKVGGHFFKLPRKIETCKKEDFKIDCRTKGWFGPRLPSGMRLSRRRRSEKSKTVNLLSSLWV
jgi:hypothetical protein